MKYTGTLSKMFSSKDLSVKYGLELGNDKVDLNALIGREIKLTYSGNINCTHCGKKTKKSYAQGHCFPCSIKLAECDLCIMKPETCHFDKGTCREPSWGEEHCMKPHVVYLANSSGLKVGITRLSQVPFRWIDQGATQALPILEVKNRLTSGLIEVVFKQHIADKTDWRKMLKGDAAEVDLIFWKEKLLKEVESEIKNYEFKVLDGQEYKFTYPVKAYPEKVSSIGLDKTPEIDSTLMGIKGQYLIFKSGVFNVRSHTGYEVSIEVQ
jgi:hypothetical protein